MGTDVLSLGGEQYYVREGAQSQVHLHWLPCQAHQLLPEAQVSKEVSNSHLTTMKLSLWFYFQNLTKQVKPQQ